MCRTTLGSELPLFLPDSLCLDNVSFLPPFSASVLSAWMGALQRTVLRGKRSRASCWARPPSATEDLQEKFTGEIEHTVTNTLVRWFLGEKHIASGAWRVWLVDEDTLPEAVRAEVRKINSSEDVVRGTAAFLLDVAQASCICPEFCSAQRSFQLLDKLGLDGGGGGSAPGIVMLSLERCFGVPFPCPIAVFVRNSRDGDHVE